MILKMGFGSIRRRSYTARRRRRRSLCGRTCKVEVLECDHMLSTIGLAELAINTLLYVKGVFPKEKFMKGSWRGLRFWVLGICKEQDYIKICLDTALELYEKNESKIQVQFVLKKYGLITEEYLLKVDDMEPEEEIQMQLFEIVRQLLLTPPDEFDDYDYDEDFDKFTIEYDLFIMLYAPVCFSALSSCNLSLSRPKLSPEKEEIIAEKNELYEMKIYKHDTMMEDNLNEFILIKKPGDEKVTVLHKTGCQGMESSTEKLEKIGEKSIVKLEHIPEFSDMVLTLRNVKSTKKNSIDLNEVEKTEEQLEVEESEKEEPSEVEGSETEEPSEVGESEKETSEVEESETEEPSEVGESETEEPSEVEESEAEEPSEIEESEAEEPSEVEKSEVEEPSEVEESEAEQPSEVEESEAEEPSEVEESETELSFKGGASDTEGLLKGDESETEEPLEVEESDTEESLEVEESETEENMEKRKVEEFRTKKGRAKDAEASGVETITVLRTQNDKRLLNIKKRMRRFWKLRYQKNFRKFNRKKAFKGAGELMTSKKIEESMEVEDTGKTQKVEKAEMQEEPQEVVNDAPKCMKGKNLLKINLSGIAGDSETEEPSEVEESEVEEPSEVDESETEEPLEIEESEIEEPLDVEESEIEEPLDVEESEIEEPLDVEESEIEEPLDVEESDTEEPSDVDDSETEEPPEIEASETEELLEESQIMHTNTGFSKLGIVSERIDPRLFLQM